MAYMEVYSNTCTYAACLKQTQYLAPRLLLLCDREVAKDRSRVEQGTLCTQRINSFPLDLCAIIQALLPGHACNVKKTLFVPFPRQLMVQISSENSHLV